MRSLALVRARLARSAGGRITRALLVAIVLGIAIVRYVIRQYVRKELTRGDQPGSPFSTAGSSRAVASVSSNSEEL